MKIKDFYILKTLYKKYGFEKVKGILEHINDISVIKNETNQFY
jgi:hypothetical protein